jgi:monoamine oxidase
MQLTNLHEAISMVEGPVHFAGEHTSLKHSWIEGALESAVRTALEVNV